MAVVKRPPAETEIIPVSVVPDGAVKSVRTCPLESPVWSMLDVSTFGTNPLGRFQFEAVVPVAVGLSVREPRAEGAVSRSTEAQPLTTTFTPVKLQALAVSCNVAPSRTSVPVDPEALTFTIGTVPVPRIVRV